MTIFGLFAAFISRCVIRHCLITENKHFHWENGLCLTRSEQLKNVLIIFINRSNVL